MRRYGVSRQLSSRVDACIDALNIAHKRFKNGMTQSNGCICAVGETARSPGFEETTAILGIRTMLGIAPIYDFMERRGAQGQNRVEAQDAAPDRIARAAVAFGAAVKQCSGGEAAVAPGRRAEPKPIA